MAAVISLRNGNGAIAVDNDICALIKQQVGSAVLFVVAAYHTQDDVVAIYGCCCCCLFLLLLSSLAQTGRCGQSGERCVLAHHLPVSPEDDEVFVEHSLGDCDEETQPC